MSCINSRAQSPKFGKTGKYNCRSFTSRCVYIFTRKQIFHFVKMENTLQDFPRRPKTTHDSKATRVVINYGRLPVNWKVIYSDILSVV